MLGILASLEHLSGILGESVFADIHQRDALEAIIGDDFSETAPVDAHVGVLGRDDEAPVVVIVVENGDFERVAAHVEHEHVLYFLLPVIDEAKGHQRSDWRFYCDDKVEACLSASILHRLRVLRSEVCRHRNNNVLELDPRLARCLVLSG